MTAFDRLWSNIVLEKEVIFTLKIEYEKGFSGGGVHNCQKKIVYNSHVKSRTLEIDYASVFYRTTLFCFACRDMVRIILVHIWSKQIELEFRPM